MCLIVDNSDKIKISDENIIVFKIIRKKKKLLKNSYTSPFQNSNVKWRRILIEKNPIVFSTTESYYHPGKKMINIGFHSFENLMDAQNTLKKITYFKQDNFVVAKCVIPKGSKYVKGEWSDNLSSSYVSNQIKYINVIK